MRQDEAARSTVLGRQCCILTVQAVEVAAEPSPPIDQALLACSVLLAGAQTMGAGTGSRLGEADRMRRPQGGLEAVATSWTMGAEEDDRDAG